ncbi:hypothetical protein RB16p114 [Escherichia phage RB16]|uniref:Conserved hypothetical phage protein n=1 Tax=Escherichia phage RB16 TaxID=2681599 RepID=D9ICH5_BPRB1|nr:hypothetical protein RB16p114 [Escherichia phage RB16]ADJ55418.1 conserved hypothetical phage protein [Escherichia phage RB16]
MIYVSSYSADYEFTEIVHVSESLQNCIDALNKVDNFPYLGDNITIDVWENEKRIAKSSTYGYRDVWDEESQQYKEIPVTFEEIMANMRQVNEG